MSAASFESLITSKAVNYICCVNCEDNKLVQRHSMAMGNRGRVTDERLLL